MPRREARRALAGAGLAHALHDGYADLIYVLLPLWQAEFGLGYGALAALRGLYSAAMAGLQIAAGRLAERCGGRRVLAAGTALAALGYALAGLSGGLLGLGAALALAGAGSSAQHPLAAAAVARAYGAAARGPLGAYNFAGDLGKAALPALTALLLVRMPWREALWLLALAGLATALAVRALVPAGAGPVAAAEGRAPPAAAPARGRGAAFALLLGIGVLDSSVRAGFLLFLPFLLAAKGAGLPLVGLALTLTFLGGAAGKFACGWLAARLGVLATVLATELGTAAAILAVLALPPAPALAALPLLGALLNGTSSVLYGTVPELAPAGRIERAFALFYTGTIGSSALSPVLYGVIGDLAGPAWGAAAAAGAALLACPLALLLAPRLGAAR
ncbi:MFS transporter [Caldovatus sp. SYSU G05006]|uniref:MFS transporter n=1 Tax=Caldovatus aquaticus TaxID=2865671 RepID=A0ABS7F1W4_9PROT|nr:MFS transporter [Caldovatus aquaticus]